MSSTFVLHTDQSRQRIFENLLSFLAQLPATKPWQIDVKQYRKERSDEQNKALWGVAYPALEKATGQSVNDWHEYMLGEYFGWIEYTLFGKRKLRPARTTTTGYSGEADKLSTADFADYYTFIQHRAAQNGVHVPDPDPLWQENRRAA